MFGPFGELVLFLQRQSAHESLQSCAAKRGNLQKIAGSFMSSLSDAFQAAVQLSSGGAGSAPYPEDRNPFTEDVTKPTAAALAAPVSPPAAAAAAAVAETGAANPFSDSEEESQNVGKWKQLESESENSTSPWAEGKLQEKVEGEKDWEIGKGVLVPHQFSVFFCLYIVDFIKQGLGRGGLKRCWRLSSEVQEDQTLC